MKQGKRGQAGEEYARLRMRRLLMMGGFIFTSCYNHHTLSFPEAMQNSSSGLIFDIRKFSIQDGPGIRTTVFLKGCPLSCWWCHNPESQSVHPELIFRSERCIRCGSCYHVCQESAITWQAGELPTDIPEKCTLCGGCIDICSAEARELAGWRARASEVVAAIEADIPFYEESGGGATFSGGEPLLQRRFLLECLQRCKEKEIHTAVDTSGYAPWVSFDRIIPYTDLFLYDLKLMDSAQQRMYTGVANELILENLSKLVQHGAQITIRVPVIPGITDEAENLLQIGRYLAGLPRQLPVDILPYHQSALGKYERVHRLYRLPEVRPLSDESMQEIAYRLVGYGLEVSISGQNLLTTKGTLKG